MLILRPGGVNIRQEFLLYIYAIPSLTCPSDKETYSHKSTDKSKKVYTLFSSPQEKIRINLQVESGEYFFTM